MRKDTMYGKLAQRVMPLFRPWWPKYTLSPERDGKAVVYLTFDDGPNPGVTDVIARMLTDRGHQATFFCVGAQAERHPQLVKDLYKGGHSVGSHSFNHLDWNDSSTVRRFKDYLLGQKRVSKVLGHKCNLFRPPHGRFDQYSIFATMIMRNKFILWDSSALDWQVGATAESNIANLGEIKPGSIILLHDAILDNPDAKDRSETVRTIPLLMEKLDSLGLRSIAI